MPINSIHAATGEVLKVLPSLDEAGLQARIGLAAGAATAHAALPPEDRSRCLRKLALLLAEEQEEIARLIALETGKPVAAAAVEVARCRDLCSYCAEHGTRMLAPEVLQPAQTPDGRARQAYLSWRPLGTLLVVTPWESPLWQACRIALPALTAGNTVLLKCASSVPQCALLLESLVRRAGFLRGTLQALLMKDGLVEAVLHDPRIAAVAVTGTESAGRALAAQAGWLLKRSFLRVIGNGATIVMPSADLDGALAAALNALTCGPEAGKRLILHSGIYSDFVRSLGKAVEALRTGDPLKAETDAGPLGTGPALDLLEEQVAAAVKQGGRVLAGGTRLVGGGNFFEPTLLGDLARDTPAMHGLTGPILTIARARDAADAIAIANSARFAGDTSIWTREPAEQTQLLAGVACSSLMLNACPCPAPAAAGKNATGAWQPGGNVLREYMEPKTVTLG